MSFKSRTSSDAIFLNRKNPMEIIVLVKQVPDTSEVKIDPKKGTLIREGVESIVNPEDLNAVEAALAITEAHGGSVTAVTMGPPQAREVLWEVLAMGVDRGVLLTDKAFAGADTLATSYALGRCIKTVGAFDLILCGRQAIDGDTAQIGPQVAEYLGVPQVTYVQKVEVSKDRVKARRALEDGYEVIDCPLPALLTVLSEINDPRLPTVSGIIDACPDDGRIEVLNAADIRAQATRLGLVGSPTSVVKTSAPESDKTTVFLEGEPGEKALRLVEILRGKNLT
jgi:electron transfer flavoprotein beta subunit